MNKCTRRYCIIYYDWYWLTVFCCKILVFVQIKFYKSGDLDKLSVKPWILIDRKHAGVSVGTYLRFVMSRVLRICSQFSVFSLFCYIFHIQTVILKPELVYCFTNMPMP